MKGDSFGNFQKVPLIMLLVDFFLIAKWSIFITKRKENKIK
jgi:hypothetical protein